MEDWRRLMSIPLYQSFAAYPLRSPLTQSFTGMTVTSSSWRIKFPVRSVTDAIDEHPLEGVALDGTLDSASTFSPPSTLHSQSNSLNFGGRGCNLYCLWSGQSQGDLSQVSCSCFHLDFLELFCPLVQSLGHFVWGVIRRVVVFVIPRHIARYSNPLLWQLLLCILSLGLSLGTFEVACVSVLRTLVFDQSPFFGTSCCFPCFASASDTAAYSAWCPLSNPFSEKR